MSIFRSRDRGFSAHENMHFRCSAGDWVWSCIFEFLSPAPLRPTNVLENSDIGHRDRSKKYICSYIFSEPRPGPGRICEKSSKIMIFHIFSRQLLPE